MKKYETPVLEFLDFQSEGLVCGSIVEQLDIMEQLEETEGNWGW